MKKYYDLFGLKENASLEEVESQYRNLRCAWEGKLSSKNDAVKHKAEEYIKSIDEAFKSISEQMGVNHDINESQGNVFQSSPSQATYKYEENLISMEKPNKVLKSLQTEATQDPTQNLKINTEKQIREDIKEATEENQSQGFKKGVISTILVVIIGVGCYFIGTINGNKENSSKNSVSNTVPQNSQQSSKTQLQNTAPIQQPQPTPPPPPVTNYGIDKNEAVKVVQAYYRETANRKFGAAYDRLSSQARSMWSSYDAWKKGFDETIRSDAYINSVDVINNDIVVVHFDLHCRDYVNGRYLDQVFRGKWDVIKENGRLVMYNPEIRKIR